MKSKLVTLFVICTLFITTGCSTSNDIKQEENISTVIEDTNQTESKKSDKLIKLHQEMLPKIKDIYDKIGIEYGEIISESSKYDGVSELYLENNQDQYGNEVFVNYDISFDDDGEAKFLGAIIILSVDAKNASDNNYDIENSIFNEFAEVMINNYVYKSDVKSAIENYYNSNGEDSARFEYENSILDLDFSDYEVSYQIIMKP